MGSRRTGQYVRSEGDVSKGLHGGTRRESRTMFWPAVLRPCRYRRPIGNHDGDLEGCRQPGSLVGRYRAAAGRAPGNHAGSAYLSGPDHDLIESDHDLISLFEHDLFSEIRYPLFRIML